MKILLWPENASRAELHRDIVAFVHKCETEGFAKTMMDAWNLEADYYAEENIVPNAILQSCPYRAKFSSPTTPIIHLFPDDSRIVWDRAEGRQDALADQFRVVIETDERETGNPPYGPSTVSAEAEFSRQGIVPFKFHTEDFQAPDGTSMA